MNFNTDNNQVLNCTVDYGSTAENLKLRTKPDLTNNQFSAVLGSSTQTTNQYIYYKINCSSSEKQCVLNSKIKVNSQGTSSTSSSNNTNTNNSGNDPNALADTIKKTVEQIKVAMDTTLGKVATVTPAIGVIASMVIANPQSISSFSNIMTGFLWFIKKEKKKKLGIIFSQEDKKPIPFAVIRLIDPKTKRVIKQTVSNLRGKYNLIVDPGDFLLEIAHDRFNKYSAELKVPGPEASLLTKNLGLTRATIKEERKINYRKLFSILSRCFFVAGFGVSIFSLIIDFRLINILIVLLYAVQLVVMYLQRDPRGWGILFDANTKQPLSGVFVSILDPSEQRQLDVQISDSKGRFGFDLDDGKYLLRAYLEDYNIVTINQSIPTESLTNGEKVLLVKSQKIDDLGIGMKKSIIL